MTITGHFTLFETDYKGSDGNFYTFYRVAVNGKSYDKDISAYLDVILTKKAQETIKGITPKKSKSGATWRNIEVVNGWLTAIKGREKDDRNRVKFMIHELKETKKDEEVKR